MNRRIIFKLLFALPLVLLFASKATGTSGNRKGFMLGTLKDVKLLKADITQIADLGGTIVRFPLYFSYEPSLEKWLNKLEAVYTVAEQRGVILIIDIHHPGISFDSTIQNIDDFVNKWSKIAQRFANRKRIWYDLCNEPNHSQWRDVALLAAQAIRRWDSHNKIVFAARGTTTNPADGFTALQGISNQIIQFHFYDWSSDIQCLPTQCSVTTAYPSANRTREDLAKRLKSVANAGIRNNVPVYIGEVAIPRSHPNAARFLRDFTSICDQLGIHLTIHAYREADIWNYENTPAWRILTSWLQRR